MKILPTLTGSLALSALLLTAQAQAPATSHDNPTPAKPTPAGNTGAVGSKNMAQPTPARPTTKGTTGAVGSKNMGQKMVEKSKPTDMLVPVPARPVKK